MISNPRYQGKPLLRLLECYVLWALGALPDNDATALKEMTPKLQSIYQAPGEWHQIVASAVALPSNMPELVRELWAKNTEIARRGGVTLTPQQFAEMFVDQNLTS